MTFHPEVMPPTQQGVLRNLAPTAGARGFYLGGGTAVAIHLGHRRSIDLDWFIADEFGDPLGLAGELQRAGVPLVVSSTDRGTLHGEAEGVRLSFLEFRYPLLQPPVLWPEFACPLASLEDLACMKLSAITNRGARKDFIDLYALGTTRFSLPEMLGLYREKFQTRDVAHVVFSLTYFDDAEAEETPEMLRDVSWKEVRRTIEDWVRGLATR